MSHIIEAFLATEFTCIPQVLDRYAGKYYSNKISNGATWVFLMWHIIHFVFEESINLLLKKMRIKEYVRIRLKQSIWYLGFYSMSFLYCTATLYKNNIDVFSHRKLLTVNNDMVPGYLILGFMVLCTFYAHSIIWEGLRKGFTVSSISFMFLTVFILLTYFARKVELSLSLLAIVSFTQFGIELARCSYTVLNSDTALTQMVLKIILCLALLLFILTHLFVIPLFFVFPLMYSFLWESQTSSVMMFNIVLWSWLLCEITNNPLYKLCKHWIDHKASTNRTICPGSSVECALFQLRDDDAYNMQIIRQEIKEREAKMIALRKPKNRNMLIQTLKCMVAIKRKLKEKKASESSDSDESEYSESDQKSKTKNSDSGSEDELSEMDNETTTLAKRDNTINDNVVTITHNDTHLGNDGKATKNCDSKININS